MRFLRFLFWFLIAGVISPHGKVMAQDLNVLVLDALDGKPQANVEVEYFCAGPPRNSVPNRSITNNEGIAKISNFCNDKQKIEISVYPPNKKEQCGDDAVMTFNDVVSVGFLSKPDSAGGIWCPKQSRQDSQTCCGTSHCVRQEAYVVAISHSWLGSTSGVA
jgi:5-hydroxyisourate hydrolase-like protein (transthyretin family)